MRYTKSKWLMVALALSLILSACNIGQEPEPTPDVGAIFTAAAETVAAQFVLDMTQTAQAAPTVTQPPTATTISTFSANGSPAAPGTTPVATFGIPAGTIAPLATVTPLGSLATQSGPVCMNSSFIADITIPDNSIVDSNTKISKRWSIQNTGTCTWDDGFSLQPITGDAKGVWEIDTPKEFVEPGEIVEVEIDIQTPDKGVDQWGGCWRMEGDSGQLFGTFLCMVVTVDDP